MIFQIKNTHAMIDVRNSKKSLRMIKVFSLIMTGADQFSSPKSKQLKN